MLRRKEDGEDKVKIISGESERIHNVKPKLTEIDFRHSTGVFQIRMIVVTRTERSPRRQSVECIDDFSALLHMSLLFFA